MSRLTDKFGNPIPDEVFDDYEGPPDRPNAVLSDEGQMEQLIEEIKEKTRQYLLQQQGQQPAPAPAPGKQGV